MKFRLDPWTAALVAAACSSPTPSTSSSSHWVGCTQVSDCASHPEAVACTDGYCVDSQGQRISSEGTIAATGGGSGTGAATSTGGAFVRAAGGASAGGATASGGSIASAGSTSGGQTASAGSTAAGGQLIDIEGGPSAGFGGTGGRSNPPPLADAGNADAGNCGTHTCDAAKAYCFAFINFGGVPGCRDLPSPCDSGASCECACPDIASHMCGGGTTACTCEMVDGLPYVSCNGA